MTTENLFRRHRHGAAWDHTPLPCRRATWYGWPWLLVLAALALAALVHGLHLRGDALQCARTLDEKTDQHIADCYTSRGLPCPADICPNYGDHAP